MKISEVVAELSKIRAEHGDIPVKYIISYGDWDGGYIEEEEDIGNFVVIDGEKEKRVVVV